MSSTPSISLKEYADVFQGEASELNLNDLEAQVSSWRGKTINIVTDNPDHIRIFSKFAHDHPELHITLETKNPERIVRQEQEAKAARDRYTHLTDGVDDDDDGNSCCSCFLWTFFAAMTGFVAAILL
jgi:hypothetical protein